MFITQANPGFYIVNFNSSETLREMKAINFQDNMIWKYPIVAWKHFYPNEKSEKMRTLPISTEIETDQVFDTEGAYEYAIMSPKGHIYRHDGETYNNLEDFKEWYCEHHELRLQ